MRDKKGAVRRKLSLKRAKVDLMDSVYENGILIS